MTDRTLRELFNMLTDEELIARIKSGLTHEAYAIACSELRLRGIEPPAIEDPEAPADEPYLGDMVLLARDLKPTEAHLLASCLMAAGIAATTGDTDTVRANSLWSIALGGAKIRVPQSQLLEAKAVLKAFRRGDFRISDDFDVGEPSE